MTEHLPPSPDHDPESSTAWLVEAAGEMMARRQARELSLQSERHAQERMQMEAGFQLRQTGRERRGEERISLHSRQGADYRNLIENHKDEIEALKRDGFGALDAIERARDERGQPRGRDEPANDR